MKNLITKNHKHLLYKDDCGDLFLLISIAEIFEYDASTLRVFCWSRPAMNELQKIMLDAPRQVEAGLHRFDIRKSDLPVLLKMEKTKKRRDLNGKWMESRRRLLAHSISPAGVYWDA